MSDFRQPIRPIITGNPTLPAQKRPVQQPQNPNAFGDLLQNKINERTEGQGGEVTLSRHAQTRAEQRGIALSASDIQKLGEAVHKAGEKGITDTLVFMNSTAFIVNVPSRTVVTMVDQSDQEPTVFSNIDGAVIV